MSNQKIMVTRRDMALIADKVARRETTLEAEAAKFGIHKHTMCKYHRQFHVIGPEIFPR